MSNLKLLKLQLALFFEEIENRPDKFINKMSEVEGNIFDQMPTILPIPDGVPPEIPVVVLNSSDGRSTCNIAKSRIDFIFNPDVLTKENISTQLENFVNIIRPYAAIVFGYKKISRFGLVGQYFYETSNAVSVLQSKYLKLSLGELEELNIRYNKKFTMNNLFLNDIVELGKSAIVDNEGIKEGVVIQRDMNNVPSSNNIPIEDVFSIIKSRLVCLGVDGILEILK